ncbi:stretch-activated cation channel mid1 [Apophysomyces ossiformis]|uniref:Stretch-activated cation channel mid1 n=1 Tax=Apophysomyces ossiformis TaxID=679940 RepID=A0A8H7BRW5_9FUNG|nr:stretch-activated cation channel mid1 [Apophysomyces ossiformis]
MSPGEWGRLPVWQSQEPNMEAQTPSTIQLNDSVVFTRTLSSGELHHFYFAAGGSSIHKRADPFQLVKRELPVYLTLTSCTQPTPPSNFQGVIPSLELFLSNSSDTTLPGPSRGMRVNDTHPGRIAWTSNANEIWIGVVAPTLNNNWSGNWTYEIAISTTQWMHPLFIPRGKDDKNTPWMTLDDTDSTNALFLTNPYTLSQAPNISVLLTSGVPKELSYSLCAAKPHQVPGYRTNITSTSRGPSEAQRQQVMVSNLNKDTSYTAYFLQQDGSRLGVGPPIPVQTKNDPNCQLIYNLEFCDQVAYSVPATGSDIWNITASYDAQAKALFQPFDRALSQFNCETTAYSLVRNCTDCYNDYKRWLCAVSIPRCTSPSLIDQMNHKPGPAVRRISGGEARNPWVDKQFEVNEWTEMLPCIDLCYRVVQSCPPFLQFFCPEGDLAWLQYGYWQTGTIETNKTLIDFNVNRPTCNRVGLNTSLLVISKASNPSLPSYVWPLVIGIVLFVVM